MSRFNKAVGKGIVSHYGNDHAIGKFIDLTSSTYANSGKDEQGEGYFFEYSEKFGISNNLADLTLQEVIEENKSFWEKVDKFHKGLEKPIEPIEHGKIVDAIYAAATFTSEDLSDIAGLQWTNKEDLKKAFLERLEDEYHTEFITWFDQNM